MDDKDVTRFTHRMRGMRVQSVRFGEGTWTMVQRMAEVEGVSASQYIREAVFARAIAQSVRTGAGDPDMQRWLALIDHATAAGPDGLEALLERILDGEPPPDERQ
jgi:hypothetical protein